MRRIDTERRPARRMPRLSARDDPGAAFAGVSVCLGSRVCLK
jgi:hypothetical protein